MEPIRPRNRQDAARPDALDRPEVQWAALAICVFAATLAPGPDTGLRPLFFAALLSAAAILWLDHSRQRLSTEALRVLADVSLLSPLLVLLLPIFR